MTTRRDRDLPSHPSTSPGGRPRIPEREITTTDVTQHASEVLTDQDFVITAPSEGDYFRHDGSDWVNVSGLPEADVTAHEAALSIAESQITDGSILARLGAAETVTGAWTFENLMKISRGSDEILRLIQTNASGEPTITFYQAGTERASILYQDTNDTMRFAVENNTSATFEWYASGVQVMFLHSTIGLQVRAGDIVCENGDVIATV